MVKQKMISARIDNNLLSQLANESFSSGINKNKILNKSLEMYIQLMNLKRSLDCMDVSLSRISLVSSVLVKLNLEYLKDEVELADDLVSLG